MHLGVHPFSLDPWLLEPTAASVAFQYLLTTGVGVGMGRVGVGRHNTEETGYSDIV